MIVPVSYRTLNWPRGLRDYLMACRELSPAVRKLLVFELQEVPKEAWSARLAPIVSAIRPYARFVFMRMDTAQHPVPLHQTKSLFRRLATLQAHGVRCISIDLATLAPAEEQKLKFLDVFAESAEKARLFTLVQGADSLSLAMGCVGAGIDYVSGGSIASPIGDLDGVHAKRIVDLYVRHFRRVFAVGS